MFGEQWDLKNRYLHISPTEEWKEQPNLKTPEQVPEQALNLNNTLILTLLYPDKPRHPRQKYILTHKGLALYNELIK